MSETTTVERHVSRAGHAIAARRASATILVAGVLASEVSCDEAAGPRVPVDEVVYRTDGTDGVYGAAALSDGGFVVAGLTEGRVAPTDGTIGFPLVLRVRANGRIADASVYRDVGYGVASAVVPFADGLAVLVSPGTLYRTQLDGEREDVLFNPVTFGNARSLLGTDDGGFVAVLSRAGPDGNDLVKVDGTGTLSWSYRMPRVQGVVGAAEAPNGDLYVLGSWSGSRRHELARLGMDGREIWRRTYERDTFWEATAVVAAGDGAAVLGSRSEPEPEVASVVVTRFDGTGELEWERIYVPGEVHADAIAGLEDGGLVFGYTENYGERGFGYDRAYVVGIAPNGEERWRRAFGPYRGTTSIDAIILLTDGRIAAVGWTGPERVSGWGGDDFDVLSVFYQTD